MVVMRVGGWELLQHDVVMNIVTLVDTCYRDNTIPKPCRDLQQGLVGPVPFVMIQNETTGGLQEYNCPGVMSKVSNPFVLRLRVCPLSKYIHVGEDGAKDHNINVSLNSTSRDSKCTSPGPSD